MKIALALGGGGAKGLAHIEFLKVFEDLDIKPSMISGTSMGALIGSLYSSGKSAYYIEDLAEKFTKIEAIKLTDINFDGRGLIKGKKISEWIHKEIGYSKFKDLKIPLKIVATDFVNKRSVVFDKGEIMPPLNASIAIPGIFPPVQIKGRTYVDGGVFNQVPYDTLKGYGVAIDVSSKISPPKMPNIHENVINCFYMMSNQMNLDKKHKPDYLVQPDLGTIAPLDFHKYKQVKTLVADDVISFRRKLKKLIK